jgi:biotin operon repressor
MPYRRSREIENRLRELLHLIQSGRHSTPSLAKALGASQPTVSRCLTALRDRGYQIHSVKDESGWHYELVGEPVTVSKG